MSYDVMLLCCCVQAPTTLTTMCASSPPAKSPIGTALAMMTSRVCSTGGTPPSFSPSLSPSLPLSRPPFLPPFLPLSFSHSCTIRHTLFVTNIINHLSRKKFICSIINLFVRLFLCSFIKPFRSFGCLLLCSFLQLVPLFGSWH